jgi:three-Cys-motif partner protein
MVEKRYQWPDGAKLEEHSKRKHKILREYFSRCLTVRCQLPQREKFRLAIVEGFSGAGKYNCGTSGSPLIFIEELRAAVERFDIYRASNGLKALEIECLLIFNDANPEAIEILKTHVAPLLAEVKQNCPKLNIRLEYRSEEFEIAYPFIKQLLQNGHFRNVIFNLDQCGHSHVTRQTLMDIMHSYPSAEIFYTFAIESLLAFLRASEPAALASQLASLNLSEADLKNLEGGMNKKTWLGVAEKLVFGAFGSCAPFVSPFSINNPEGWRYWLIHFANSYRAGQWYNDILHQNSSYQAHFGRSGLDMLSYDPSHDSGALYLFDMSGRSSAKDQLTEDIPRLVSEFGDAIEVGTFYESIYNATPAHTDDIHSAIIDSPDLEVITGAGGERRKPNTIVAGDIIRIKNQRSFFPMFSAPMKPGS